MFVCVKNFNFLFSVSKHWRLKLIKYGIDLRTVYSKGKEEMADEQQDKSPLLDEPSEDSLHEPDDAFTGGMSIIMVFL